MPEESTTATTTNDNESIDTRPWYRRKTTLGLALLASGYALPAIIPAATVIVSAGVATLTVGVLASGLKFFGEMLTGYGLGSRVAKTNKI